VPAAVFCVPKVCEKRGLVGRGGRRAAQSGCGLGTGGGSPAEVAGEVLLSLGRSDFFRGRVVRGGARGSLIFLAG
jgi:hypothetical protein